VYLADSELTDCHARINAGIYSSSGSGGAIHVNNAKLFVSSTSITSSDSETYGGAVAVVGAAAEMYMMSSSITDASAGLSGGAVYVKDSPSVVLADVTIAQAQLDDSNNPFAASVVHVVSTGNVTVYNSQLSDSAAPALVVTGGGTLAMFDSTVIGQETAVNATVQADLVVLPPMAGDMLASRSESRSMADVDSGPYKSELHVESGTSRRLQGGGMRRRLGVANVPSAALVVAGSITMSNSRVLTSDSVGADASAPIVACSPLATSCVPCSNCGEGGLCTSTGCDTSGQDKMCAQLVGPSSTYNPTTQTCNIATAAPSTPVTPSGPTGGGSSGGSRMTPFEIMSLSALVIACVAFVGLVVMAVVVTVQARRAPVKAFDTVIREIPLTSMNPVAGAARV